MSELNPHGPMRRKDREITDRAEIDALIHASKVMHLGLADGGTPFVVPVFYAYDGASLFFHSAKAGTKIEMLKRNNLVCFEITADHGIIENDAACDFEASHRTVIGLGRARFVEDEAEKTAALTRIVARFSSRRFEFPAANLKATAVVRIDIESVKGKKHGF
jgi:nitroimidazol reductase NimA-like FMN-containing flavoprotein (pyridoxamine 5'-phosphate oxidase superfamily)